MVHFVSTQPGRETVNRVPRSCWQQRPSVRVPLLVPTASPFAASYAVFLSVRTRALHLSLCLSLSLSLFLPQCVCVSSSSSSPNPHFNPHPSAQRYSRVTFHHFPCFFPPFPFPSPSKAFLAISTLFSLFPPFNNSKCPARLAKLFSVNAVMPDECFFLNCAVLSAEELLLGLMMRAPSCLRLGLLFFLERREEENVSFLIFWGGVGRGGIVYVFAAGALGFLSWP